MFLERGLGLGGSGRGLRFMSSFVEHGLVVYIVLFVVYALADFTLIQYIPHYQ